jgi:hypothetical protein
MFLLYYSEGCNICEMVLHECYINDLHTTTCSGMLGHHTCHTCGDVRRSIKNVLDEGLRIGGSRASDALKGKVSQTRCISKVNVMVNFGLLSIYPSPSSPGPYI